MRLSVALLGCGNVGAALLTLLTDKADALRTEHDIEIVFTGGYTRRGGGWLVQPGIGAATVATAGWPHGDIPAGAIPYAGESVAFARACPADVLVELTTLEPQTAQPALDHVRAALTSGKHVATANKGPIAHAYRELRDLATARHRQVRFESTVMDGTPIFNMVEAALPVTRLIALRGVLNSTSNYILGRMVAGDALEAALAEAQRTGIAEANPDNDLEGWDASVKAAVLANALMGADLRPQQVHREGLGAEAMRSAVAALTPGHGLKQVVDVTREGAAVVASVRLAELPPSDPLGHLGAGETSLRLSTDTMGDLSIIEGDGGPWQTAHGVMADLVTIRHSLNR
ncbi:MAG TPA: hypothetical protein VF807_08365 [Ktedonobacterales bacterium]